MKKAADNTQNLSNLLDSGKYMERFICYNLCKDKHTLYTDFLDGRNGGWI